MWKIDDIDLYRCREGRLGYLGWISFIVIALVVSCILFHDAIGGAIIDFLIPAVFSAILVLGVTLYNISLLALLLPFCVIIGSICYVVFIYRPALAGHSNRTRALRQIRREATISSNTSCHRDKASMKSIKGLRHSRQNLFDYMRRVSNMVKYAAQSAISNFSDRKLKTRAARRAASDRTWCCMNMPSSFQGIVQSTGGRESTPRKRSLGGLRRRSKRDMFSLIKSKLTPPAQIANMMMIAGSKEDKSDHNQQRTLEDPIGFDILGKSDELIIVMSEKNSSSPRILKSLILFDARDALLRMRSQLSVVTSRPLEDTDYFDISESDLCSVFKNIFETFYPDGISMSAMEMREVEDLFTEWKKEQNFHFRIESNGSVFINKRMIYFHLFERWFIEDLMSVIHNTVSERLLVHSFKFPPIVRIKKTNETSPHPFDTTNSQDEGRLNMKGLRMVTAHSLSIIRPPEGVTRENSATHTSLNMSPKSDESTIVLVSEQQPEVKIPNKSPPRDPSSGYLGNISCPAAPYL